MPRTGENDYTLNLENADFKGLSDTPESYVGEGGKVVVVKATEDGLDFVEGSTGGSTTFEGLIDTPNSYTGEAGKIVTVNDTEDGLVFLEGNEASLDRLVSTHVITAISGSNHSIIGLSTDGFKANDTLVGLTSGAISRVYAVGSKLFKIIENESNGIAFIVGEKVSVKKYPVYLGDLENVDVPNIIFMDYDEGMSLVLRFDDSGFLKYKNEYIFPANKVTSLSKISSIYDNGNEFFISSVELDGFTLGDTLYGLKSGATGRLITSTTTLGRLYVDSSTRIGDFIIGERVISLKKVFRLGDLSDMPVNDGTYASKFLRMSSDGKNHEYAEVSTDKAISTNAISVINGADLTIIGIQNDIFSVGDTIEGITSGATALINNIMVDTQTINITTQTGTFQIGEKVVTRSYAVRIGDLADIPSNTGGNADKMLVVSSDGINHEYRDEKDTFEELTDTPNDYTGKANNFVLVNDTEDGLKFTDTVSGDLKQLKAISTLDQAVSSGVDGTVVKAETIQVSDGISMANGEITIANAGTYRFQLQLNIQASNNTVVETWAERWTGIAWVFVTNSGAYNTFTSSVEGNTYIETTLDVLDGEQLRLKIRTSSGTASLDYLALDNTIGVPSVTVIGYELEALLLDTGGSGGVTAFTGLTDTPSTYVGSENKTVAVNSTGTALEFIDTPTPVLTFSQLTDTPSSYIGESGKSLVVNTGENGVEYKELSTSDISDITNVGSGEIITSIERTKLDGIEANAEVNIVDSVNTKTGVVVLDTSDIADTLDKRYITDSQQVVLGNTSGTNTGDQDLSTLALKTNVLEKDNTTAFTPTADYHPATKKYVDDSAGGGGGGSTFTTFTPVITSDSKYQHFLGASRDWVAERGDGFLKVRGEIRCYMDKPSVTEDGFKQVLILIEVPELSDNYVYNTDLVHGLVNVNAANGFATGYITSISALNPSGKSRVGIWLHAFTSPTKVLGYYGAVDFQIFYPS